MRPHDDGMIAWCWNYLRLSLTSPSLSLHASHLALRPFRLAPRLPDGSEILPDDSQALPAGSKALQVGSKGPFMISVFIVYFAFFPPFRLPFSSDLPLVKVFLPRLCHERERKWEKEREREKERKRERERERKGAREGQYRWKGWNRVTVRVRQVDRLTLNNPRIHLQSLFVGGKTCMLHMNLWEIRSNMRFNICLLEVKARIFRCVLA